MQGADEVERSRTASRKRRKGEKAGTSSKTYRGVTRAERDALRAAAGLT